MTVRAMNVIPDDYININLHFFDRLKNFELEIKNKNKILLLKSTDEYEMPFTNLYLKEAEGFICNKMEKI